MARVGVFPADRLTDNIDGRSLVESGRGGTEATLSVDTAESELQYRSSEIVRTTTPLMSVLSVARRLCLPDWLVFSGAVYQPVLNHLA